MLEDWRDLMLPYNNVLKAISRELRSNQTDAEQLLWQAIRKKQLFGAQFYRQKPIAGYIADFYCHKLKLVIEADGGIHNKPDVKEYDAIREQNLTEWGYVVVRFTNEQILKEEEKVIRRIVVIVDELKNKG